MTLSSMRTISMELGCSGFKKLGTSHNLRTLTLSHHFSLPGDTADTESNELSITDFDIKPNNKLKSQTDIELKVESNNNLSSQMKIANCESEYINQKMQVFKDHNKGQNRNTNKDQNADKAD